MKKLMIAAAALLVGFAANAATTAWNISYSYQPGASTDDGPMASGWAIAIFDAYSTAYTQADVIKAITSKDTTKFDSYKVDAGKTFSDGNWSGTKDFTVNADDNTTSAYVILFNNADWTKADKYFVGTDTKPVLSSPNTFAFGDGSGEDYFDWTQTADAGGWQSVPEPTSGLLLLIGVAGQALKRKRA